MAEPHVADLIRRINQLVEQDTGALSMATGEQLPRMVTLTDQRLIEPLASNLDVPARLAPGPGREDPRPAIRAAVTEVVAACAHALEPEDPLPEPADEYDRIRLGTAISRAYAESAMPRLVPKLFANGRADDLGVFPAPVPDRDVAAARAIAVAISARTGRRHEDVLTSLVAAGRGAVAPTAARMLLDTRPGYPKLPEPEQQWVARAVADKLESGFASRDLGPAEVLKSDDVIGGTAAVDAASAMATREVQELHEFLQRIDHWSRAERAGLDRAGIEDPMTRFVSDLAVPPLTKVQGPAGSSSTARTATPDQKSPARDRGADSR